MLTNKEREQYAVYAQQHPIDAHQRERERQRAEAFPRLLAAYIDLDNVLAEGQGYCEELSRKLEAKQQQVATSCPGILAVRRCARCGDDHEQVLFTKLSGQAIEGADFWGTCPVLGQPILLEVREKQPA